MPEFTSVITSEADLRDIIPEPPPGGVWDKTLPFLEDHCKAFIAASPFVMIASCDTNGRMDVSPKGDPPGFVHVLDATTLAIPDRPGNGRADTFRNLLANPRIGLYFLVPGRSETLRISGSAQLVRDQWLLDQMAIKERPPHLAIVVNVEEAFFHCAKCIVRSNLWDTNDWQDVSHLAPLGKIMRDQLKLEVPAELIQRGLDKDIATRLY